MIELSENLQERKMQIRLMDLDSEIKSRARDIMYKTHLAMPEQGEELVRLILERNNLQIAMETK